MRQVKFSEYEMEDGEAGCFILQKHVFYTKRSVYHTGKYVWQA
jgi:hypothetical protein